MKKIFLASLVLIIFAASIFLLQMTSCTKSAAQGNTRTDTVYKCPDAINLKGSYSGTYIDQFGQTYSNAYVFSDNNFMYSAATLNDTPTAFGSYSNDQDSIRLREWNSIDKNYYYLAGKLTNNNTTIVGYYKNLSMPSAKGSIILVKQ